MAITSAPVTDDAARTREEERLARRAADGDGAAFATLYDRYERRIYNYCLRLLTSSDDAADATQDAFLKVLQRLPKLGDRELNFSAYLYTAARNASYDMIGRRKKAEPVDEIPEPAGVGARELGAIDADPERAALLDSLQAEVQDANARLPERQREVLAMRELQEMSYDEIAEIMGMNRNSVAQLISRARIKLRDELRGTAMASIAASSPDCERALPLISMRQDGQLKKADDREWLEAHVRSCDTCKVAIEAIEEAGTSYRAWLPIIPLEFLRRETIAKAAELVGADWNDVAEAGRTDEYDFGTQQADTGDHPELDAAASKGSSSGLLHLPASWVRRGSHAAGDEDSDKRRKRALVLGILGAFLLLAAVTAVVAGSGDTPASDEPVGEAASGTSDDGSGDGSGGGSTADGGGSAAGATAPGASGKGGKDGRLKDVPLIPGLKVTPDGKVVSTKDTGGSTTTRGRRGRKPSKGGGSKNTTTNNNGSSNGGSNKPARKPARKPSRKPSNNGGGGGNTNTPSGGGGNTTPSGGGGGSTPTDTPPAQDPPAQDPPAQDPPAQDPGSGTNPGAINGPPGGGSTPTIPPRQPPSRPPSTNGGGGSTNGGSTPPRCPAGVRC
jgi:RNA polymerase sigma factor (sigma-70 family)